MQLEQFDVLAPEACAHWAQQVMALRRQWTARHARLPFYTLGLAAYLDAVSDGSSRGLPPSYHSTVLRQHNNQVLSQHFEALLDINRRALSQHLQRPARYVPTQAALPGFHIHLPHPAFAAEVASVHRDLQFMKVFPQQDFQPDQVITFTLPLSLPPGSGLQIWDDAGASVHPYQLGQMVVHDGLHQHQAVLHPTPSDVPRIMLQGHGVLLHDELLLYW